MITRCARLLRWISAQRKQPQAHACIRRSFVAVRKSASNSQIKKPDSHAAEQTEHRSNELGIQMLSANLHDQLFPKQKGDFVDEAAQFSKKKLQKESAELAKKHLQMHGLYGKNLEALPEIEMQLPPLVQIGNGGIQEHFYALGKEQAEPYLSLAEAFASATLPPMPTKWVRQRGWVRYAADGSAHKISQLPAGESLVFDVETMYKVSEFPALAVAASEKAWYSWCSPEICGRTKKSRLAAVPSTLIPIGATNSPRIIVGHNVAYDRSKILDEYNINQTRSAFIDTMSLHCAVSGMSSQQRNHWKRAVSVKRALQEDLSMHPDLDLSDAENEIVADSDPSESIPDPFNVFPDGSVDDNEEKKNEEQWMDVTSLSSLKEVALFHLGHDMDKSVREIFSSTSMDALEGSETFQEAMRYCAEDVRITHRIYAKLLPKFRNKCPHPVSFAGMLHMGKCFLPVTDEWPKFIERCEKMCEDYKKSIQTDLVDLAENVLDKQKNEAYKNDPWLSRLDWFVKPVRMTKPKISADGTILEPARPFKNTGDPKLFDKPAWYRELWDKNQGKPIITPSKRIVPYLLRLKWNGNPVSFCSAYGWMYSKPKNSSLETKSLQDPNVSAEPSSVVKKEEIALKFSRDNKDSNYDPIASFDTENDYFKIPHPDGGNANCGNLLSKLFNPAFESGQLQSEFPTAQRILQLHAQSTYWISNRSRVMSQFVVWDGKNGVNVGAKPRSDRGNQLGVILPKLVAMGTVTRRAVEPTWLTASNAKAKRIGSELKSLVVAPEGWSIIGADVDSEELWIASLMGDAQFGIHGSTAIGFMTLQGTKSAGTDLHSVTGRILGISRDQAKIFNYGRIYGAGCRYAIQLLLKSNPHMTEQDAKSKAEQLYAQTKGSRFYNLNVNNFKSIWFGGTESVMFNVLEKIALSENPRTPVLGCQTPDALMPAYVNLKYMTSRVNWVVQSSGVDYLHLLLVSMDYLMRRLKINGRFMISIHDEVRYIVHDQHVDLACLALQISNIWVRSMFSSQLGIDDLPLNVAFFSLVDVDHCLRKEVDMSCLTPTNMTPLAPGVSYSINKTIERLQDRLKDPGFYGPELKSITETVKQLRDAGNETIIAPPSINKSDIKLLKAQISEKSSEVMGIVRPFRQPNKNQKSKNSGNDSTDSGSSHKSNKKESNSKAATETSNQSTKSTPATNNQQKRKENIK